MDEIQKVNPRAESLKRAREAKAAKRIAAASQPMSIEPQVPLDDVLEQPAAARQATRTPVRGQAGEVLGRNGEVLSRKRTVSGDIFEVPTALIPKGWSYQWAAISITGNTEILLDQNLMFAENGWRPVPADRYPGRFMPEGYKGNITRGGQMLMERPTSLCEEAHAEDIRAARQLISDRNESLKLSGVRKSMGDGFEMSGKYRGTGGSIKMSIDPALDAPMPSHKLEIE